MDCCRINKLTSEGASSPPNSSCQLMATVLVPSTKWILVTFWWAARQQQQNQLVGHKEWFSEAWMRSCLLSPGCRAGQSEQPLSDAATAPRYNNVHQSLHRNGRTANTSLMLSSCWVVTAMTGVAIIQRLHVATGLHNWVYISYNVSLSAFLLQDYQEC